MKGTINTVEKTVIKENETRPAKESIRKDVTNIPIQEGLTLVVYWKALKIGKGPAVILKVINREILKFDCFGNEKGHYHIYPNYNNRIWFVESNSADQISRTRLELERNGPRYLRKYLEDFPNNPKHLAINSEMPGFARVLDQMEARMIYFLSNVPELQGI